MYVHVYVLRFQYMYTNSQSYSPHHYNVLPCSFSLLWLSIITTYTEQLTLADGKIRVCSPEDQSLRREMHAMKIGLVFTVTKSVN